MHARIRLPQRYDGFTQGQCLDFFTAHVSPSMRKLLEGFPEHLLSLGDNARLSQFSELGTFIASKRELGTELNLSQPTIKSYCDNPQMFRLNQLKTIGRMTELNLTELDQLINY